MDAAQQRSMFFIPLHRERSGPLASTMYLADMARVYQNMRSDTQRKTGRLKYV